MTQTTSLRTGVLVAGGGTAGCLAALAAAEGGAGVILIEGDTALGGVATRGGIHRYYYGSPGGMQEVIDRRTALIADILGGKTKGFHPDAKRIALMELCREKNIRVYLDSVVYEVMMEGADVSGVRVLTPEGPLDIHADVTIDSTGNAHLTRMAGGRLRYGRKLDGIYHNYSLIPRRMADGEIGYDNLDAGWVDPYDLWDVSRAFTRGREWIREGYAEGAHYFAVSSMLGVREGGLIAGDATVSLRDYIEDKPSPDVICRSYSHLDNHGFDTGNESEFSQLWIAVMGLFGKGLWCDIPYGALLPQGIGRLLVAGRALSVDRDVGMGVRMQRDMHKVGEAAGTAAALSIRTGCSPRTLDRSELQERLVARGVLERRDIGRTGSRNLRFREGPLAGREILPRNAAGYSSQLADYLETEERWKAAWLLAGSQDAAETPDPGVVQLLAFKLEKGSDEAAFCAAITLVLLGRKEPVPYLLKLISSRDPGKLGNHPKCVPFWIASFVLLRMLKNTAGLDHALAALDERPGSVYSTFLLDYLSAVSPQLSADERRKAAVSVKAWLASDHIGEDYKMHVDRPESLRWSLELRAAAFLAGCEGEEQTAARMASQVAADPRGYVRNAAARLIPGHIAKEPGRGLPDPQLGVWDTAVIGGTAAGLLCAAELARLGKRVVLIADGSSLLTETTKSRLTAFMADTSKADGSVGSLTAAFRQEGAWDGEQLEPVLAQLAADRFLQQAGVRVLYEARCLEIRPHGEGCVIELAHKNGRGVLYAQETADLSDSHQASRGSGPGTLTGLLIGLPSIPEDVSRRWIPWKQGGRSLSLRLRPGYYPGEAYLDLRWHAGSTDTNCRRGELLIVQAMKELRKRGCIPEKSALAYLADQPWPDGCSKMSAETGLSEEADYIAGRMAAGLAAARALLRQ